MAVSILEKIRYMLELAGKKEYSKKDIVSLKGYAEDHSNNAVIGRFMGYSISDYALATLYWLDSKESKEEFEKIYDNLQAERKKEIDSLIRTNAYLQL